MAGPIVIGVVAAAAAAAVLIVIAPWRRVRAEGPLPDEVEARILLGERADEIDVELREEEHEASPPPEQPPLAS